MEGYYLMPHPPLMIPQVGKGEERKIQDTVDSCIKIGKEIESMDIDTVILVSPHGVMFSDAVAMVVSERLRGNFGKFGVPEVSMSFDIDKELTSKIIENANKKKILVGELDENSVKNYGVSLELDHGAMVPLYYLCQNKKYKLVHITYGLLSKLDLYSFGMAIKESVDELKSKAVFVASGDLSHRLKSEGPYDYSPYGKEFDESLINILQSGDMEKLLSMDCKVVKEAGECGLRSLYILAGAMDGMDVSGNVLSYEGTFGVGYGVVKFLTMDVGSSLFDTLKEKDEKLKIEKLSRGDVYTQLARKMLYNYYGEYTTLGAKDDININSLPQELKNVRRGVFVSLKKEGELRGCIGTISPVTSCVGEEIMRNAVAAATEDPRFPKVNKVELGDLDISVDVLYEPEVCKKEDLDTKIYGVIVSNGNRRGLLLPNLEGVDTVDYQISIALQKGSISPNEDYTIERFKVERHKENNLDD